MGAFLTGLAGGLSEGLNQASNRNEEREDELLESQAAPLVARLKEPGLEPEDANTLRGQLVKMYGPKNGHKAIAKLNEIYGVNPQAAPQSITTERPAVSVPGGPTLPAEAPLTVGHAPRTVSDILAMGNQMANPKQSPLQARVDEKVALGMSREDAIKETLQEDRIKGGLDPKAVPAKPVTPAKETQQEIALDAYAKKIGKDNQSQLTWDERLQGIRDLAGNSKVPMPGSVGWFNILDPHDQHQFLKNQQALSIAKNPYGLMNAISNRMRAQVSEQQLDIAKDRLLYGPETGNVTTLEKGASMLENEAQDAEAREKNVTPIGDTGIIMAWVKSQIAGAGRLNNTEIEQALQSGTFNQQISNKLGRRFNGTLDDEFRHQMVSDIRNSADVAKNLADTALGEYQQGVSGKPPTAAELKEKGNAKAAKKSTEKSTPKTTNDKDPLGIL